MVNKKFNFIAEISANHNGSLSKAKKLIKTAKENGADSVKIQIYEPDDMTIDSKLNHYKIKHGLWKNYYLYDLYKKAHTPRKWFKPLFNYSKKIGIQLFTSVFDIETVDFLEKNNCPIYKIASFEITHIPLIKRVAQTKKPMIISTGMANMNEIENAFRCAKKNGCKDISLLYCVSNYPSKLTDFNLNNILYLKKKFNCKIGLSDHSNDPIVAFTAISLGAELLEKHIALQNQTKGLDIDFSLRGKEIKYYSDNIKKILQLTNSKKPFLLREDLKNKIFRRSIVAKKEIKKGEKFSINNIKIVRPNIGLDPKYFDEILKKKSKRNLKTGSPLKKNDIF